MTDDPTVTGPKAEKSPTEAWVPRPDEQPPEIAGGTFTANVKLRHRVAADVLLLDLDFGGDNQTWYGPAASAGVSIPAFEDETQAQAWLDRAADLFVEGLQAAIEDALRLLLLDVNGRACIDAGLNFFTLDGLIAGHMTLTETLLRQRFGLAPRSRYAPWTAPELATAIFRIMRASKITPTYQSVAEKLQTLFPGRPPTTGEALRKVVKDYGINWMKIKRVAKKRSI